ncbi:MAG: hypothetical protein AUH79_06105 [Betaproteobacteria bacterium 13_1_40CM_4_64_4]|nr:MAG: hypothetical protein AUH79_06105 [Betaproteobacteria bacterium 13_1_40CM_4_64_4]
MNPHIPDEIAQDEEARVISRRRKFDIADNAPPLGIAVSGGGIRSATVSLGVFQYLAHEEKRVRDEIPPRPRLLSRIDYMSSVSGGGYFATFFGSLFLPKDERAKGAQVTPLARKAVALPHEVRAPKTKWQEAAERATDMLCDTIFDGSRMTPMRWLRENGRYLAPTGGGDYLYAAAVAARNFVGLHYVIAVSLVAIFLLAAVVRVLGFAYFPEFWVGTVEAFFMPEEGGNFWPSMWWVPALATFALLVVPISVGFFLAQTERKGKRIGLNLPLITAIGVALLCFAYAFAGEAPTLSWFSVWFDRSAVAEMSPSAAGAWGPARFATAYIGLAASLAVIIYLVTKHAARQLVSEGSAQPAPTPGDGERDLEPTATTVTQTMLSHSVMEPLMVTLALAAYALVDTIGQTVYALWTVGAHGKWLVGGGTIAVLIPLLKKLLPLVTGSGDPATKSWVRIPMSTLAFIAGVALFVAVASLWSALTQGLVWNGERPAGDPGCVMIMPGEDNPQQDVALDTARRIVVATPLRDVTCVTGAGPLEPASWAWLFVPLLVISIFTGRRVGFINLSSLQRYYAGYLMRSYLRASLFAEDPDVERNVRNPARADDITVDTYYNDGSLAPVHFINVTMNQTVASGSQLVQRDRKGVNVAIGPLGFSIGNRSFVKWDLKRINYNLQRCPATVIGEPDLSALPRYVNGTRLVVEPLSIGNWCAISGAAFTTGHGKGTTLGLSLLLALTNVRLGYWWDAEVEPPEPTRDEPADSPWFEKLSGGFRTQRFLLNEMLARYYGTRRSHWYLSDGGHFENTAAYELIRRRVPRIIVLDNGRDADYAFDDIANLVRKARIDLDAEIEFLTSVELSAVVDASVRKYFGTPEEFRPDHREPVYATLARVRYQDAPEGLMLVLKPRVAGIEPLDILNYKEASSDFPQQSTTDQFYDEAQWESYRGLGYWIAEQLFGERDTVATGKWVPRKMFE